jgi:dihydrodipicolinate synthase/N-acetylneuraminate lyase
MKFEGIYTPIITPHTEDCVMLAKAAKVAGADFLLVNSPPYAVPTDEENSIHALQIDQAANLPIMLYNYPGRTGTHMGEEYLNRVGRSNNFCGIKESSGDINRVHLLAYDYPNIELCCGMWPILRPMRQVIKRARFSGELKNQQITATIRVLTLLRKLFKKSMVGFV